jgi:hypothetical protein
MEEKNTTLQLTQDEAIQLSQLIDLAIKTEGLNVAKAAFLLHNKLFESCSVFRDKTTK